MSALYRALFIIFIVNSITLLVRVHVHIVNVTYVTISGSYGNYWNAFKRLAEGASASEKADLFRETARRFYSL